MVPSPPFLHSFTRVVMPRSTNVLNLLRREERQIEAKLDGVRQAIRALSGTTASSLARPFPTVKNARAERKRGRMSTAARKAVSLRMKRYWAKRRKGQGRKRPS